MESESQTITATQSDVVSQSEVERLLAQVGGENVAGAGTDPQEKKSEPRTDAVEPYDFRQRSSLSAGELRRLRMRHEGFIRLLAARLSVHLRLDVSLQMLKFETSQFHMFVADLSNPTYLALLKLEPLQGICLLEIPPRLGLCIVDRELGGPATTLEDPRVLSEIESRILSRSVKIIASEWCSFWADMLDLRSTVVGYENNASFVQTAPPDTAMLILGIQVRIGEITEQIQIGFPIHTLEPLIQKLKASNKSDEKSAVARPAAAPKWNPAYDKVKINLTAELPDLKLTVRQLSQLKPGDVLEISSEMANQIQVSLGKKPKFIASLGTSQQRWAAKIVAVLDA